MNYQEVKTGPYNASTCGGTAKISNSVSSVPTAFSQVIGQVDHYNVRLNDVLTKIRLFHERLNGAVPEKEKLTGGLDHSSDALAPRLSESLNWMDSLISDLEYQANRLAEIA